MRTGLRGVHSPYPGSTLLACAATGISPNHPTRQIHVPGWGNKPLLLHDEYRRIYEETESASLKRQPSSLCYRNEYSGVKGLNPSWAALC